MLQTPITRHAAVNASAAATLQEVSNGRVMIGIGRGDPSLFSIGFKPANPDIFQTFITELQSYLSGDVLNKSGYDSQLRWLVGSKLPKVPLDVAATGPKIIAMGAELAERVSFSLGADIERIKWGVDQVKAVVNKK